MNKLESSSGTAATKRAKSGPTVASREDTSSEAGNRALDDLRIGTTKSLNAALIETLRADLVRGEIAPDVKLKIPDICTRYGVSPGVAREALSRLVPEGHVDFVDQRGFRTPPISSAGIRDITRVRSLIEKEALIDSMRHGDADWESQILAALHRLSSCQKHNPDVNFGLTDEWSERHKEFHRALIGACTSPWLIRMHNMLYDQTERYRFIAAKGGNTATGRARDVGSEHDRIAEATIAGDETEATRLMGLHLQSTADRALAVAELMDR